MSFFGWAMIFVALGLLALATVAVLGLRLWCRAKALAGDVARASSLASRVYEAAEQ